MAATRLGAVAPVLCVREMKPAIDYFERSLGFALIGAAGDGPSWAALKRDEVEFMLLCGNYPAPAQDWAAYVRIGDADALHGELQHRGTDIVGPPVDKPYRCREFEVRLPDGRRIAFGQDI